MPEDRKLPDLVLYIVLPATGDNDSAKWIRIGVAWKARKGFSVKLEELAQLFPPFNSLNAGMAIMPYETREERENNRGSSNARNDTGRRR